MTKRIFITGYYGFGNTGDEAILTAMIAHLRELRPDLRITATSATPEVTAAVLNIDTVLWSDTYAMLNAVQAADLVVIGGGGIFHDYWGFNPAAFLTDSQWGINFYAAPAAMAMLFDKPVMLYAVGVGPLFSNHAKQFTKFACDVAATITVRDVRSKTILESLGVHPERITTTVDPAFGLPLEKNPGDIDCLSGLKLERPLIAVALRPWNVGVDPHFWEQEAAAGLDLFLDRHPGSVWFVPFQRLKTLPEDDLLIAQRVQGPMRHKDRTMILVDELSPQELVTVLGECDLVVGMRLHSMVLGMLSRTPVLALSYDEKLDQLMGRAQLQTLNLDIRSLDSTIFAGKMAEALATKQGAWVEGFADMARQNARIAIEIVDRGAERPKLNHEILSLLGRGVQAQIRESHELRQSNRHFLHECEHYQNLSSSATAKNEVLSARVLELETKQSKLLAELQEWKEKEKISFGKEAAWREERGALLSQLDDLSARVTESEARREEERRALLAQLDELLARATESEARRESDRAVHRDISDRLRQAGELRRKAVLGLDQFHLQLTSAIETYRAQRAWKVMLAIRKGYTLFTRGRAAILIRWIFTLPFSGIGTLDEFELRFPNIWNFMPECLETVEEVPANSDLAALPVPRSGEITSKRTYDVVILAIFDFEFRFQRPQQIAAQLARLGHRVFWVSPARFLSESDMKPYAAIPLRENIWEVQLRGTPPDLYGGRLTEHDAVSYSSSLKDLYRDFQVLESCALLQFPYWRRVGLKLKDLFDARVVYDCMDDWQNWTAEPRIGDFSLSEELELVKECDVLLVSARHFYERHKAAGVNPLLVRNGADFGFFASSPLSHLLEDFARPIVGYYGAIADWFDLELVAKVAETRPEYTFVIIGHVHHVDVSCLQTLPNVHFLGEKNYREIPRYLVDFDVCLIPFKLNNLTKAVDPVKLYEYLSLGKPVVATDMSELPHDDQDLLYIGMGVDDFVSKVDLAVAEAAGENGEIKKQRRIAYAQSNTWAVRCRDIDKAISETFPLVSMLIVTFNCEEFIGPCLGSILRNTSWPNYEVIVVDNDSSDGGPEILERYQRANERIRVIRQNLNRGFAEANNRASEEARGEYLLLLNPDTIVPPGWLGRLVRHCEMDRRTGAVAAVTNFSGNETKIRFEYGNSVEMENFAFDLWVEKATQSTEIAVAPLYCVLVPRSVWTEVGGLDAGYQIGMFEDDDFSHMVRNAGYRVIMAEDCFVHHFGNGSFAKLPQQESLRVFEQNKRYFETKWKNPWVPHKLRRGVRPPNEEIRFTPAEFVKASSEVRRKKADRLVLRRLHPATIIAREPFNSQADGVSALMVECANATPTTVIVMGSMMLPTTYGNENLLSAIVPPEMYAEAGLYPVYLTSDFGDSNRLDFEVESG